MAWKGVITNGGSELLAQWTGGKTLTITRAAAGTGRISEAAMLAQTALVNEKQAASIVSNKTVLQGQHIHLQLTPQALGYALNQLGVWAKLESGAEKMIALFQTDTDAGVEIPSKAALPDYVYTFYGLLELPDTGGTLQVITDESAAATAEIVAAAIKEHNDSEDAHKAAFAEKQDMITANGLLVGDGKGGVSVQQFDTVPTKGSNKLLTSGAVAAALAKKADLDENGKVRTDQLPINTPGGLAGLDAEGELPAGRLPEMNYVSNDQLGQPGGVVKLGKDGKISVDNLPEVSMTAQIIVTAPTGSTVTATLGSEVYTAEESGDQWTFNVKDYGTYIITATKDGDTATREISVEVVQQYFVTLSYFRATIHVTVDSGSTVTCTKDGKTQTKESTGSVDFTVKEPGTYTVTAAKDDQITTGEVDVTAAQQYTITLSYFKATIHVTVDSGSTVTCTKDGETQTKESTGSVDFTVKETGTYSITATKDGDTVEDTATITAEGQTVNVALAFRHIYGVLWDGTSTTVWSRTDEAADFVNPTPYVAGASSYGSPFDDIYPWNGMVRVTDSVAGELVAIPKFWFKWTKNGNSLKLQIADKRTEGFYTSPAHADRGDGKGERDVVYIGRYHCHTSNYKSQTGGKPKANITRSAARSGIHALGDDIWQSDIQLRVTIWMLYLVEFADWNSQKTIGKGCGDHNNTGNMGYTDSMPYHTGTTLSSRDTYGLGTQYRYIEGLWDNVQDWGDGCYSNNSKQMYIIMNPSDFNDSSGGTAVGVHSNGWPSAFTVATVAGLEWVIYPTATGGSENTYSADYWSFGGAYPCVYFGGCMMQYPQSGLFYVYCIQASGRAEGVGCRLQKLP